jgi:ABC-2 type transport system permease protein
MICVLLQQVRRDRVTLPIWILGTVALLSVAAASVVSEYGDDLKQILSVALATPALLALRGIPNGDSVGSAVHFQSFAFLAVTIGLMNVFLATRHGRADEEKGRRELLVSTPIARLTPPVATLILALVANGLFAVLATFGYQAAGVGYSGAILSAVALAVIGLAFFGVGALASELTATSRAGSGIGAVVVLGAYALRAGGDALGTPDIDTLSLSPAWLSYVSPIGWGQLTLAFTENRWEWVVPIAALAVVTVAAALLVHARRELGASLLPERAGRPVARRTLSSPFALAWRLQWPTVVAWAGGSALLGLALGSLVTAIANSNVDNPQIEAIIASLGHDDQASLGRALIPAMLVIIGALAGAAGVQAVLRLRDDEADGRAEAVLTTPVSKIGWLLAGTAVGVLSVLTVLVATGLTTALGFAMIGNADDALLSLGQALVQAPSALVFVGVAVLAVALVPRISTAVAWLLFAFGVGWGLFGGLFGAPDWTSNLSPIGTIPTLPTDDWVPTLIVGGIAVAATVVAALAFRRRDLVT